MTLSRTESALTLDMPERSGSVGVAPVPQPN
jgi:hypothetical protein